MAEATKTQVVEYQATGGTFPFHVREITAADWKKAGVEGQKTVTWSKDNNFRVPVADLSADALKVIEADSELKLVTV